jgi:hypothetical protein
MKRQSPGRKKAVLIKRYNVSRDCSFHADFGSLPPMEVQVNIDVKKLGRGCYGKDRDDEISY